jgi:filamentous hemagglutinin family protein
VKAGADQTYYRRRACLFQRAAVLGLCFTLAASLSAQAGDILRGGSTSGAAGKNGGSGKAPGIGNPAAEIARANAKDALSRTTAAVQSVKAMQAAARDLAIKGPNNLGPNPNAPGRRLPDVPDGLALGGLKVAPGVPVNLAAPNAGEDASLWKGSALPTQTATGGKTKVTIKQTQQQAVLNWDTFNIGKKTTLQFDQSAGKTDQGKWTAFNKINDPSGAPSQILGSIEAPGHVYVLNRNGILFGGSSQVNVRALVASSLPINDNLIRQGLLNNPNAEFLFATPRVSDPVFTLGDATTYTLADALLAGTTPTITATTTSSSVNLRSGTDFTIGKDAAGKAVITFTPAGITKIGTAQVTVTYLNKQGGDVTIQPGARINARASGDGNGGRIMLVGANVTNEGTLSAPAGQTILAAGLQVGVAAHAGDDPSLRGLDVFVGAAGEASGKATNNGLIEVLEGSASMSGRRVLQLGVIESSTTVSLNGRIDLFASYGAVSSPNFDNTGASAASGAGGPPFLFQHTGVVTFGEKSVTRILPAYASEATVPGTALPEKSQINVEGQAIHFAGQATLLAPNANVTVRAGLWPYKDLDGNLLALDAAGLADPGLGSASNFLYSSGQIYLDAGALINVAGSTEVFVPLTHSILDVEFRGAELADSPLQRDGPLRGVGLTLDIRNTGVNNGRYWMGTPLGDATGLAGLVQRNAAQLTTEGGNVTLRAGGSIVVRDGATVDVSGGYFRHEAGMVQTSRLLQDGRLVDIKNALPGQEYDGVYTGTFTRTHGKWGVTETFASPFAAGARWEESYLQGANGGTLTLNASSMALDGALLGNTVQDPRARAYTTGHSSLSISFTTQRLLSRTETEFIFLPAAPTPPEIVFARGRSQPAPEPFTLAGEAPTTLRADRVASVILSPGLLEEGGFGHLSVENNDGEITVTEGSALRAPALGSISLSGRNVTLHDNLAAPGGELHFTAYNYSPVFAAEFGQVSQSPLRPAARAGRGIFTLGSGVTLDLAGLIVDDRLGNPSAFMQPLVLGGGEVSIEAYSVDLQVGSMIDVSGGVAVNPRGVTSYGDGGSISIRAGENPGFGPVLGGTLTLGSTLSGYAGGKGGSLTVKAGLIQIGDSATFPNTLLLQPEFFRQGGFTNYSLIGIGGLSAGPVVLDGPDTYQPAIQIEPGIRIEPVAESWLAVVNPAGEEEVVLQRMQKPVGLRSPVSLSFTGLGADDDFTTDKLEVRGDIVMGRGAQIVTDPGASVSFKADTVTLLGSVTAPGGAIAISGASRFRLPTDVGIKETFARPTVHLGSTAQLSVAGTAVLVPDLFGRRLGTLYPGGSISVTGNIVAQAGAILNASGAAGIFDLEPSAAGAMTQPIVPLKSGLTAPLFTLRTVPTMLHSDGGTIDLQGSQMLLSDATLLGFAGGPTAIGGTLSIFSGRYYVSVGAAGTSADINLVVTQSQAALSAKNPNPGIGLAVRDQAGAILPGMGYFAVDRFTEGGFHSLDLGFKYLTTGGLVPFGGNLEFRGPISIAAPGNLRVAGGGVIQANAPVSFRSSYFAAGQPFRAPLHPLDTLRLFTVTGATTDEHSFGPTFGPGRLTVEADLIDLGTLSLQNIGRASFMADGGDIRGNGTLQMAGDLILRAAQIYPTTLSDFNIFVYDHDGRAGSVSVIGSGLRDTPLSAGGSLSIFASKITQGGVLRAPFGSITLGWDGTDFDLSDADLDAPDNPIARTSATVPTTQQVTLGSQSLTSVAGVAVNGTELLIPFGLSPDGTTWIDPRGLNVTTAGLPEKRVSIAGNRVTTQRGSTVDVRGGGDLAAFRWVAGPGGSIDLLGDATRGLTYPDYAPITWSNSTEYAAGDLVASGGKTWSARVRNTGQQPSASLYWSLVPESFAIIPGFQSEFAPYAPFNTGANAGNLGGDPGHVSSLHLGEQIYLENVPGLGNGTYTLLPRRYALLPGAYLITPQSGDPIGTFTLPGGASYVSGYTFNEFKQSDRLSEVRTRFEVASGEIVRKRAEYTEYSANSFFAEAAERLDVATTQELPRDAGYLALHGNTALHLSGGVLTHKPDAGRGAAIDVSSFADMYLIGENGAAPGGATVVLDPGLLQSWGAESLVIGGLRRERSDGTTLEVRTSKLVLDNPGQTLAGPEITLASKAVLALTDGSAIQAKGSLTDDAATYLISGDGTLLRVSAGGAAVERSNVNAAVTTPLLTLGAGARITGARVLLDSTYGSIIDPAAIVRAQALALGSGQISILLEPQTPPLAGSVVDPHLVLAGEFLAAVQRVDALTLRSYRTIDFYGSGTFGGPSLSRLELLAGGIRGYEAGSDPAVVVADDVRFGNPTNVAALAAPAVVSGSFQVDASTVRLGANAFAFGGYENVRLNATSGVLGQGTGSLTMPGNLTITTPLITGLGGATQAITAGGTLILADTAGTPNIFGGLGARFTFTGASVLADTSILLPSGQLTLRATTGDVTVGGELNTAGTMQEFYDLVRYSDGGTITLTSETGEVTLLAGSKVSVAAPESGGNAGTVKVEAAAGAFSIEAGAELLGGASAGMTAGSFLLDTKALASFDDLSVALNTGGFFQERNFRVRSGDIVISNPGGQANVARNFIASTDLGSIRITGTIDASGLTGGRIVLATGGNLTVESGALLTVHGEEFSNAGKGGEIRLEAGAAVNGVANVAAVLDLQSGAKLDLGVDAFQAGDYTDPTSSAFRGQFTGKLHLRAPRSGNDVRINAIAAEVTGASSVLVEAFRIYDRTATGTLDNALRTTINTDATSFINAGGAAIRTKLLTGNPNATALDEVMVISPGVEIINRTGNLTLGLAADNAANDWNLATFRYGADAAPGVLTLRAAGNLVFNNALSDGFNNAPSGTPTGQQLWLSQLMDLNPNLPINTQSWSFRLAAGSDLSAADFTQVRPLTGSNALAADSGSLFLGKFYVPTFGVAAGANLLTANIVNNRYQVIRTGAGDIEIAAGRDVQLRNQFATIYTAGVRLPTPTTVFTPGDFVLPIVDLSTALHPIQPSELGAIQQRYPVQYSMAGGDVAIAAGANIGHYTQASGALTVDSTAQLPTNWLYRRGYVDSEGTFGLGGVDTGGSRDVDDLSASTTWWIDFSNFFQGIGALGGGNVTLLAGLDIVNADALAPTNARMAGQEAGVNIAPDADKFLELGGGDITIRAGNNIDGGVYYVERGTGTLSAGGAITTNRSRSPSLGLLLATPEIYDPLTWLPTTLFLGKGSFEVSALGDVLLGPVVNPFLLPQGLNNKFWNKTYFSTYSEDAEVNVSSFGGDVTHRLAVNRPNQAGPAEPILIAWMQKKNLYGQGANTRASNWQPWIRLAETVVTPFDTAVTLMPPTLRSTAFAGDVNMVGPVTLFPSASGTLELAASGGIIGLQPTGKITIGTPPRTVTSWTSATINVSDASPSAVPGFASPLAYQSLVGRGQSELRVTAGDFLVDIDRLFAETGSYTGDAGSFLTKQALHDSSILHRADPEPVRLFAGSGDITGLTLFSPKAAEVLAANDLTDVSLYIQNVAVTDISVVSAGRDIIPNNENSRLRSLAGDLAQGNTIVDPLRQTVTGSTRTLAGDLQISGPGVLEVLAGRDLDLGTGSNFEDGTGVGLVSVGNFRNPFLPFDGADIIAMAGVSGVYGGPALGLSRSTLDFSTFDIAPADFESAYLSKLGLDDSATAPSDEQKAIVGLEVFYRTLRDTGRNLATAGNYATGEAAVDALFGTASGGGEIFTRARDVRTATGGSLLLAAPGGGVTMASDIFGNPLTPPGVVTEFGGAISIFTDRSVDIGQARIFTLRGGDITIWSSQGNIAAGNAPRTVVTAPPTRVVIDVTSADVQTDLGGLATGGGIGVLASVEGVPPGDVDLIAPKGTVDAGDAGIRVTGNLSIAATAVLNASNIQVAGTSAGVPSAPSVAAPNLGGLSAASNAAAAGSSSAREMAQQQRPTEQPEELPSIFSVEVLGYGDGSTPEASPAPEAPPPVPTDEEEEKRRKRAATSPQAA